MSVISGTLSSAITHAVANNAITAQSNYSASSSSFGSATNLTLSPAAQAAVSAPAAPAASSGSGSAAAPAVPIATTSSTDSTDTSLLVAIAKAQVIPKVGVTGASLVVDSQGNINQVKLNELINQQAQQAA